MKKVKYIKVVIVMMALLVIIFSCAKSFLDRDPLGNLQPGDITNAAGVKGLLIGAYSLLDGYGGAGGGWESAGSNWVYGGVASDDAYKGSDPGDQPDIVPIETYSAGASNYYFNSKWSALYDGIQRSNDVLRVMGKVTDMTDNEKTETEAEVRFLRAHYHFEAKKMWNMVPYIDETITYLQGNYNVPNTTDIWPKIEADFKFAIDNLPEVQTAVGRANNWAAKIYLAKAYLYQHKYTEAKNLFDDAIAHGVTASGTKYALVNFFDNFNAQTKNSAEAVFSAQQSVNDGSSGSNGGWGDVLNFPYNGGPGGCCGFYQPSQSLVNSYRVDAIGLPLLDTWNSVNVKSDQGLKSTDPFTPETAPLDPRIDLTIGRRGIPYLDWGKHPGQDWIRDQNNGGPYSPIKRVYFKKQTGSLTDVSFWTSGVTANNYTIIRFADVLLMAAECDVELNFLNDARTLVNQVRQRAADPTGWVHTYVDDEDPSKGFTNIPAANYKIALYSASWTDQEVARKAVQFERKLELGMEGHRFFDLVRYGHADMVLNAYVDKEKNARTYLSNTIFTKGTNEYFPIPQDQIDLSKGTLKQNPGY